MPAPSMPQVTLFGVLTIPDIASEGADFVNRLQVRQGMHTPRGRHPVGHATVALLPCCAPPCT